MAREKRRPSVALYGWGSGRFEASAAKSSAGAFSDIFSREINIPSAIASLHEAFRVSMKRATMTCVSGLDVSATEGRGASEPKTFVGEVMRAAKKAGHVGDRLRSARAEARLSLRPRPACRGLAIRFARLAPGGDEGARCQAIRHPFPLCAAIQTYGLPQARRRHP